MRKHLTFANVCSLLALFIAIGTGGAYAANTIGSSDIINDQVYSADVRNDNLTGGGLTGADIRNQSGVDTCTHGTVRLGELCFRATNSAPETWSQAINDCGSLGLRLPSFAEAAPLAARYNLPNLGDQDYFWTSEYFNDTTGNYGRSLVTSDGGGYLDNDQRGEYRAVCVTTPTN
jgi:hypothetical protein